MCERGLKMKKFVIDCGRGLIDVSAWIIVIAIIIAGFNAGVLGMLIVPLGILAFVIVYYFLYVLIDIRDNLQEINSKINKEKYESNVIKNATNHEQNKSEIKKEDSEYLKFRDTFNIQDKE